MNDADDVFGRRVQCHGTRAILSRRINGKFAITVGGDIVKLKKGSSPDQELQADLVPLDEPVFLLRARDYLAVKALRAYREECALDHCTVYQIEGVTKAIEDFNQFALEHPERMKQPGITKGE